MSTDVLVESFEEGDLITRYVRSPHRHNAMLAQTGVDVFLTMMLKDNFIHADLHPGACREGGREGGREAGRHGWGGPEQIARGVSNRRASATMRFDMPPNPS